MSSLASDQTVAAFQHSELIASAWDLGRVSRELIMKQAESAGFRPLPDLGKRIEAGQWIEPGHNFFSSDRQSQELAFVEKSAAHSQSGFLNDDYHLLFLDNRGRAYTNLGLDEKVVFDGALSAFRVKSKEALLWTWGWLNSQNPSPWQENLEAISHPHVIDIAGHRDVLVPDVPKFPDHLLAELTSLALLVNSDVTIEEEERSTYRSTRLVPGSPWQLRQYERPTSVDTNKLLGAMVSSVLVGRSPKSEVQSGLASTGGKWLLSGKVSNFQIPESNPVVIGPGSVVTPSIGTTSRARITDQEMALANGHYALIPNTDVNPEAISDFLNSRHAQQQRLQEVQSGIIPRLTKRDLLNFEYVESKDVRSSLKVLVSRLVRN